MPGFCVNCGAPLMGAFCGKCGAKAVAAGAAPPVPPQAPSFQPDVQPFQSDAQPTFQTVTPPAGADAPAQFQTVVPSASQNSYQPISSSVVTAPSYSAPAYSAPAYSAPAKGSSGLGKVLLIVGGVLVVLFVIGIAGAVYGLYWAKHKVSHYAEELKSAASGDTVKPVAGGNSCRLLSTADLQQVLGITIEKSAEIEEESNPGCAYYTDQESFKKLQQMALAQAKKQSDEVNRRPGPKPDNLPALLKDTNQLEGIMKTFGMSQPSPDGRVFSFSIQRGFDEDAWSGMRLTEAAVPGFEEVHGVGDHAMIGAFGHAFYFKKGDAMVHMNTMMVPDTRTRGAALARKIMANL